ncbi:transposase [Lentilactobacillus parabuchneri]|uniref:transposase n=1 Tax=Lentilactobacillus parabuchneri TaxID=152331 RepID=UPI00117B1FF6|nr:transposase [Lentilactobacillus parabuchneri]MCW4398579.1 transposase [Lentilactobacillus parabuchneri]
MSKGRPSKLTKTNDQEDDELQKLKDENEILKLRNAHLENLSALAQKKRKSQIKKKSK